MGILTGRKTKHAITLADQVLAAPTIAGSAGDPFSLLPSPPAPCPACGLAILWLPTTLDAWRCPACSPPPIRKMIATRVVLVDVPQYPDQPPRITPQWFKLSWVERDGHRSLVTMPIRCEANGTALVDAGGVGGVAAASRAAAEKIASSETIQQGGFFVDESLGPPIGADGNRLDDDEWFAAGASDVVWDQFFEGRK